MFADNAPFSIMLKNNHRDTRDTE